MRINHTMWTQYWQKSLSCLNNGFHCCLCSREGQSGIDLCGSCQQWLKPLDWLEPSGARSTLCPVCGELRLSGSDSSDPLLFEAASAAAGALCSACTTLDHHLFTRIIAPYRYAFPVDKLIKRVKYSEDRQLARVLGTLLGKAVSADSFDVLPDLIVPMPQHTSKWLHRGFNQAQDIAFWCSLYLNIAMSPDTARRIVDTGSLAGLNRVERQQRILGAFRAEGDLFGKHIALVDDVMTTGSSARELAREIYDSGAASVELWVLARTSSTRNGVSS